MWLGVYYQTHCIMYLKYINLRTYAEGIITYHATCSGVDGVD